MNVIDLRQNLISTINTLPSDMLKELDSFLHFLEYKKYSKTEKEEILKNLKQSSKEMSMIQKGNLKARSAKEFLDEL